jgi:hypothetical protein
MNNFDKAIEQIEESLKDWFKPHRDKRTGKKFKGWVNCRTGGPCSSKSKGGKYPVCRPTHAQCKPIKGKMHKKKGPARVQWKEAVARGKTLPLPEKKETVNPVVKDFFKYAIKKLGIQKIPVVVFNTDKGRVNELRSMAGYMPSENKIWVYTNKRNAADIIRSLAHELIHCKQQEDRPGERINGSTGSEDENEANSVAGILLRNYGKENPLIYEAYGKMEEAYKISSTFTELPDTAPYGFWIDKNGKFVIINKMFGHDEALRELYLDVIKPAGARYPLEGLAALQAAMKAGMIRMVKMGVSSYGITYHPLFLKGGSAKKTAKDIAEFYNMNLEDDFEAV